MSSKITDQELINQIAKRSPKGRSPVYQYEIDETTGKSCISLSPLSVLDETEEDYGLKADMFINESIPENTKRAYIGDIQYFFNWKAKAIDKIQSAKDAKFPVEEKDILEFIFHNLEEMPIEIENSLIADGWKRERGLHSVATVKRRLISVTILHKMNNQPDPCASHKVKSLLSAMEKKHGKQKKSKAITKNVLENLLTTCSENSLIDIRDKALILFGWASGGRRRSEIANAVIENLQENADGDFIYHIEKSKTDQKGKGHDVPVKGKAAIALREWLKASKVSSGKLFRSVGKGGKIGDKITEVDINRIIKKRCEKAGYDPKQYSAHSLRRGFITEAGKQGCPLGDTMALSGHKSVPIAMQYYESGAVINNKAANLVD